MDGKKVIEEFYSNKKYVKKISKDGNFYRITFVSLLEMEIFFSSLVNISFNNCKYYELDEQDLWALFDDIENNAFVCIKNHRAFVLDKKSIVQDNFESIFSVLTQIK